MQSRIRKLSEKVQEHKILIAYGLACIILLVPQILRLVYFSNLSIGGYSEMLLAQKMLDGSSLAGLLAQGFGLHHAALALSSLLIGAELSLKLLPFLCGILTVSLLLKLFEKSDIQLLFMLMVLATPGFIYAFTVFSQMTLVVPIIILALVLMDTRWKYASFAIFSILPLFGIGVMAVSLLCIFFYSLFSENRRFLTLAFILELSVSLLYLGFIYLNSAVPEHQPVLALNFLQSNLIMFGAQIGFTLFMLILAAAGFVSTWKQKKKHYGTYMVMLILGISGFSWPSMKVPLSIFFAYLAAIGLLRLLDMRWELKVVANLTILTILVGLVLSPVLYSANLIRSGPQPELVAGLIWLKSNSDPGSVIFSDYRNGFYIEYFAKRPAVIDPGFEYRDDAALIYNDSLALMKTRDPALAQSLIGRYSIDYILIDDRMRPLLAVHGAKGLPFLLESIETFKKVYSFEGVEIWQVQQG